MATAFELYEPSVVLVVSPITGALGCPLVSCMSHAEYKRAVGGQKALIERARTGQLVRVHSAIYDPRYSGVARVERDCIMRDVIRVGAPLALAIAASRGGSDDYVRDLHRLLFADQSVARQAAGDVAGMITRAQAAL